LIEKAFVYYLQVFHPCPEPLLKNSVEILKLHDALLDA
jgi:hypothetical protein